MLNEEEEKIFKTKMDRLGFTPIEIERKMKSISVSYWRQDNFVTAVITHDNMGVISVGVVKRNPIDTFSEKTGVKYSFLRAIENFEDSYKYED